MKKLLYLGLCIVLSGCHQLYYVPTAQNVPLFREKNEFRLSGSYALGDESQSGELQTAYSITNHFGIMTNFMKTKIGSFSKEDYVTGLNYDFAAGYFQSFGEKGVFEVYGGFGQNRQHHGYPETIYNSTTGKNEYFSAGDAYLKYRKIYIQPAYGFVTDYFDIAFSLRLNQVWYTYIDHDIVDQTEDIQIMDMLDDTRNHYILEPAVTLRTGWRYFKFQFQASYAEYLNDIESEEDFYDFVEGPHLSWGLYITLTNKWKK